MQARSAPRSIARLLGEDERLAHQAEALVRPALQDQRLVDQRLDDDVGQTEPLAQLERPLDVRHRLLAAAPSKNSNRASWVETVAIAASSPSAMWARARRLEQCHALLDPARGEEDLASRTSARAASARAPAASRIAIASSSRARPRPSRPPITASSPARASERPRSDLLARKLCGPLECPLRLERRSQRRRALGGAGEPAARLRPDVVAIGRVGVGRMRVEVVRRDHLGDLVGIDPGIGCQEACRREVARPAVAPRDRLVGDALDERLQEAELPALRRERIGLDRRGAPCGPGSSTSSSTACSVEPGERGEAASRERLAEDRGVLKQLALASGTPSSREAISACSDSGTSSESGRP